MAGLSAFLRVRQRAAHRAAGTLIYLPYIIKEAGLSHNVRQSPNLPGWCYCTKILTPYGVKAAFAGKSGDYCVKFLRNGVLQNHDFATPLPICPAGCQLPALTAPDLCAGHSAALRRQKLSAPIPRGRASSKKAALGRQRRKKPLLFDAGSGKRRQDVLSPLSAVFPVPHLLRRCICRTYR